MNEWFAALSTLEQTLFAVALFSTLVFAIQVVFSLFGIGEGDETVLGSGDLDQAGFTEDIGSSQGRLPFGDIFTIRNSVSFLMGFSWGGLMAYDWGLTNTFLAMLVGLVLGSIFVAINMGLFALMSMLKHEGNVRLQNAIGRPGTVSLAVPAGRTGVGKVSVSVQGRLLECHAVTEGEAIPRNASVTVLGLAGSQLIVGRPEGTPLQTSSQSSQQVSR